MKRFLLGGWMATCGTLLLVFTEAGTAAPIPKDASKVEPTPELKAAFDIVRTRPSARTARRT